METNIEELYPFKSDTMRETARSLEIDLQDEAKAVIELFRKRRTQLQAEYRLQVQHDHPELTADKVNNKIFAPINVGVRLEKDGQPSLEIYWFNTRRPRKKGWANNGVDIITPPNQQSIYKSINMNSRKRFHYHMPSLLKHAKPWEKDLVREIEEICAGLRLRRHVTVIGVRAAMDQYDLRKKKSPSVDTSVGVTNAEETESQEPPRDPMEAPAPPRRLPATQEIGS